MHLAADAVPAVFADHRITVGFGVTLDGMPDIAEGGVRAHHADRPVQAFAGDVEQLLRLAVDGADPVHLAAVAEIAVLDHRDVDVDDIAVAEDLLRRRPAMADHLVDRGVHRERIAVLPLAAGNRREGVDDVALAEAVDLCRADAWPHHLVEGFEDFRGERAGHAHALDFLRALDHPEILAASCSRRSLSRASSINWRSTCA